MKTLRLSVKQTTFLEEAVFDVLEEAREARETLHDEKLVLYERILLIEDRYESGRLVFEENAREAKAIAEILLAVTACAQEYARRTELGITNTRTKTELAALQKEVGDLAYDLDKIARTIRQTLGGRTA